MGGIHSASGPEQPSREEILLALQGMLASEMLRLSERNRRFLSFVVRQAVEGRADRIKAYAIGVDVFGRDDSFDPTLDPIVRIEATRLRSALVAYYDGPGQAENVRISIPKGSYIPVFSSSPPGRRAGESPCAAEPPVLPERATIVINDRCVGADPASEAWSEIFVDALLMTLRRAHFRLRILPADDRSAALGAINALFADPGSACSLDIAVRSIAAGQRYSWRLIDLATAEVLASDVLACTSDTPLCADRIQDFAAATARTIAELFPTDPAA